MNKPDESIEKLTRENTRLESELVNQKFLEKKTIEELVDRIKNIEEKSEQIASNTFNSKRNIVIVGIISFIAGIGSGVIITSFS